MRIRAIDHEISFMAFIYTMTLQIMHLRGQLYILKRCKDEETEEDFGAPLI